MQNVELRNNYQSNYELNFRLKKFNFQFDWDTSMFVNFQWRNVSYLYHNFQYCETIVLEWVRWVRSIRFILEIYIMLFHKKILNLPITLFLKNYATEKTHRFTMRTAFHLRWTLYPFLIFKKTLVGKHDDARQRINREIILRVERVLSCRWKWR